MNIKSIEQVAKNSTTKWYYNKKDISVLLGCTRQKAAEFLKINSVPYYNITGRAKSYFLPDVLEAIEKTKWKNSAKRNLYSADA